MAYDITKSHKKQGFTLSLESTFLKTPQSGPPEPQRPRKLGPLIKKGMVKK